MTVIKSLGRSLRGLLLIFRAECFWESFFGGRCPPNPLPKGASSLWNPCFRKIYGRPQQGRPKFCFLPLTVTVVIIVIVTIIVVVITVVIIIGIVVAVIVGILVRP